MANQGLVRWQSRTVALRPLAERSGARGVSRIFDEMDRIFDDALFRPGYAWGSVFGGNLGMAIDLTEDEDGYVLLASLPGVKPSDVDVSLRGTTLTISAKRLAGDDANGRAYLVRERWGGEFTRTIDLPVEVDADRIEATFENGTLRLALPKAAAYQPKRIAVKEIG